MFYFVSILQNFVFIDLLFIEIHQFILTFIVVRVILSKKKFFFITLPFYFVLLITVIKTASFLDLFSTKSWQMVLLFSIPRLIYLIV